MTSDISEFGHCSTQARRLPCSLTEGEPWHDQRSQRVPALVRGAIGGAAGVDPRPQSTSRAPPTPLTAPHRSRAPSPPPAPRHPAARASLPPRGYGCISSRARRAPSSSSRSTVTASSGWAIATMRSGRSGSTAEILVAEHDWQPPRPRFAHDQIVGLCVAFADLALRDRVKQAGGTWNPERRVWHLRYDCVAALGLNGCIVDELASTNGCQGSSDENLHTDARSTSR